MDHPFISVRIELKKDKVEITSATQNIPVSSTQTLFMQIPPSSTAGHYTLKVEGNYPHTHGGTVFMNETEVVFSPQFLSIVIQTSRPVYKAGQVVHFRVLLLTTELKPFEDSANVYILNSDGLIMRRWVSIQINNGVISHKFTLPQLINDGFWKIRVEALGQIEDQNIRVENYFSPLFEVHVSLPAYTLDTEKYVSASISARSAMERIARGNATFRMYGKYLKQNDSQKLIWEDKTSMKNGKHDVLIPMDLVESILGSLKGIVLRLEAEVTEYLYGETMMGFSHTRIISGLINLYFLGASPMIFKPGMLFEGHVIVAYSDGERLSGETLAQSTLRIEILAQFESGSTVSLPDIVALPVQKQFISTDLEDNEWNGGRSYGTEYADVLSMERYWEEGILYFKFDVPPKVSELTLRAFYEDAEGGNVQAKMKATQHYSPNKKYMSVRSSSTNAEVGEFAVFHVKTNFILQSFQYVVLTKGLLLFADKQTVESPGSTTTFALPIDQNMAPGFTLLVYHVTLHAELIADSMFIPVIGFNGYEITLEVNQGKDHTKKTAQAIMTANAGAFMGINSMRSTLYFMQAGNDISRSRITESFFAFENFTRSEPKVKWRSRQGLIPDEVSYFPSMSYGLNSYETLRFSGVVVLTDAYLPIRELADTCRGKEGYKPCFSEGCFLTIKMCDGYNDCEDWSDESDCSLQDDDQYKYRILRMSRSDEMYDTAGNDWGWKEMNGEFGGEEFFTMDMPAVTDEWYFTGFTLGRVRGFTTIDTPIAFSSTRPFMMHIEGPTVCHHGEQIGLRLLLLNNEPYEMFVVLTLHASPQYKFVHVEEGGIVTSYGARLSGGDHQHLVYLPAGEQLHVDMPVAPVVKQGDVAVTISAMTQVGGSKLVHNITVLGEGAMINKHTAVYLDLKNKALVLQYLDIYVEESPIIPYQSWRRYVYGSTSGYITVTGDIIGPAFPAVPLTAGVVLRRELKGTDGRIFELAVNIWTLHYLRLTNQLKWDISKQVLEEVNVIFAQVMKRFDKKGWFKNWDTSQPSVWLTSWVIRIFKHASFQDWENLFYVEPQIFTRSIEWILQFQTELGSFAETAWYQNPLDTKMQHKFATRFNNSVQYHNITLTAHILITIHEVTQMLQGSIRTEAAKASIKAVRYLEHQLSSLTDPYEIAITTYALTLCDSTEKEFAFNLLHSKKLEVADGLPYWSRVPVPANRIRYENQRPFISPRDYETDVSLAVEATSYALMVYVIRDTDTFVPEKIVKWLTSVRMGSSAFISTTDTVIALQALTEYAFRGRLKDITDMSITLELPSTAGFRKTVHIDNTSFTAIHIFDVPNVWGHLNVIAKGSGQAVVQMDISFGVDYEGFKEFAKTETFNLEIKEFYSTFRNKSYITIQSCFRWLLEDPPMSGLSVLEVELPTGYNILESEAERLVQSRLHPKLRDAKTKEGKIFWFFEQITQDWTCFNHTVRRWYPVANLSLYRQVQLYESHAKENFVMILVNSTPLYILNICEVCGSYQCPYCPYYSRIAPSAASKLITILSVITLELMKKLRHFT
ncbi:CD109 antigen [Zootermopsis nevadensis]|uniref:CD109 antigen n=3 Tax=Zootermopsis nevadensis TaxID=136037 RepID=A0A067QY04_ZOONE|nr:CD109 antigen [Zootermopsis nevadensis]